MSPEAAWMEYKAVPKRLEARVADGEPISMEQWNAWRSLLATLRDKAFQTPGIAAP